VDNLVLKDFENNKKIVDTFSLNKKSALISSAGDKTNLKGGLNKTPVLVFI